MLVALSYLRLRRRSRCRDVRGLSKSGYSKVRTPIMMMIAPPFPSRSCDTGTGVFARQGTGRTWRPTTSGPGFRSFPFLLVTKALFCLYAKEQAGRRGQLLPVLLVRCLHRLRWCRRFRPSGLAPPPSWHQEARTAHYPPRTIWWGYDRPLDVHVCTARCCVLRLALSPLRVMRRSRVRHFQAFEPK